MAEYPVGLQQDHRRGHNLTADGLSADVITLLYNVSRREHGRVSSLISQS